MVRVTDLPLPLVVGGALPGWTVRLSEEWRARREWSDEDAILTEPMTVNGDPDCWHVLGFSLAYGMREVDWVPTSALSLVLPGPRGCQAFGLQHALVERLGGSVMDRLAGSTWLYPRLQAAAAKGPGHYAALLSTYIAQTDALAAARGWPTGPGAPVYGWSWSGQSRRWLLSGDGYKATYALTHNYGDDRPPVTLGITDPLDALIATWRRECAR